MLSVFHYFKSLLPLDKKKERKKQKKTINNKSSEHEKQHSIYIIQETQRDEGEETKRENKENIENLTCHNVPQASFFHRKPPILLFFVCNKNNRHISNGCQQVAEWREGRGMRKPHDIITALDHAHDPAASRKTIHTHAHTLQVMQLTHTYTHILCKTKYKHRLT